MKQLYRSFIMFFYKNKEINSKCPLISQLKMILSGQEAIIDPEWHSVPSIIYYRNTAKIIDLI